MSRDFLSNFERKTKKEDTPPDEEQTDETTAELPSEFNEGEYNRNLCFVWPDGSRVFFPYARLDSGRLNSDNDTIQLAFGVEVAEIIGLYLLPLFSMIMDHKKKFVYCDDARYNDLSELTPVVNEINIHLAT